ncbi:3-dehydro-L-gulonate 2-dehydrogenase [Arthrospiribacter ruber]|uniref:3-dehydro-L-gulonate 2-dehydrogenase n=1 Tax=Arthrospiribacter ruber TaxID=2487934 RepID=A0A951IWY0_9BACT|nr:3-dehydro-L-gulonate 2-dehydrogenase [Arthrospiribacter ruber]MBW3468620.1 3-dehydro-L-gulonate 2-dehydrogenase [Arthrospiribacter ruber]
MVECIKIPFAEIFKQLTEILNSKGFSQSEAENCAWLFAQASLDGVPSHGLNRFPLFCEFVDRGIVDPKASPELILQMGMFERWDGRSGAGPLNAQFAMYRAIQLSMQNGIGMVALQNTNHWMRAGNYGLQATEKGCIGICFTNTKPNMPAWGGSEPKLGNNPLVIAIPKKDGPLLLDMAMSQFAYGRLQLFKSAGQQAHFEAGFDDKGGLTKDPEKVLNNELALPIGLWKGAGLSLMLDILCAVLSGGNSVHQVAGKGTETCLSQVFISISPVKLGLDQDKMEEQVVEVLEDLKRSAVFEGQAVRYPGEHLLKTRKSNMENGVPVESKIWEKIKEIASSLS